MKKIIPIIAVAMASLMFCTACGGNTTAEKTEADKPAIFTPGTYSGSDRGFEGAISVDVVLTETDIESITVTEQNETPEVGGAAMETIIGGIIENQKLDVDGVSGATLSSNGILNAVTKALMSADVDVTTLGGTPVEEEVVLPLEERLTEITPEDAPEGQRVFNFKTDGTTCTTDFNITLNGTTIENIEFFGDPCEGNSNAIIELVKGMKIVPFIRKCDGILCSGAGNVTSCPDQLAQGMKLILKIYKDEGMDLPILENGELAPSCSGDCNSCPFAEAESAE